MSLRFFATCLVLSYLLGSCGESDSSRDPDSVARPTIFTTFFPTTDWTRQMMGDVADVVCPVPYDQDPITWSPPREAIAALQRADVIVLNGAKYEKWIERISLPESRIVDTADPMAHEFLTYETLSHSHGGGDHTHQGVDGHTWLDPTNAVFQADVLRKALIAKWPEHQDLIESRATLLEEQLKQLDQRLTELSPRLMTVGLLANHPAYDYLARRYGWKLENLDVDPNRPLDESTQSKLSESLADQKPTIMLFTSLPTSKLEDTLSTLGIKTVWFSPAEGYLPEWKAEQKSYVDIMNENIDRLEAAL